MFAILEESEAAHELIAFLRDPQAHEIWMRAGSFLTPHKGVDPAMFRNDSLRRMNEILLNATTFRFDGSDLMPGGVGAGSFWTGMVDYVGGKEASAVAAEIQRSWDALK